MKTSESVNSAGPTCDIIMPTFNGGQIFENCIKSLVRSTSEPFRLIVVNNGTEELEINGFNNTVIIKNSSNLGWIGGINAGLKWCRENSKSKFICFLNDDIQVLDHDYGWLTKLIYSFQLDENIGGVGPTSNAIMGYQSITHIGLPPAVEATRLSGMCFMVRRDVVEMIGLLDDSLPGGDDLDYSIRIRDAGYKLCICRRSFLIHHYASTGKRVHGAYWDSRDHTEAINHALIRKHGFKKWISCVTDTIEGTRGYDFMDPEEKFALAELEPYIGSLVLDLGCGGKKLHESFTGVDIRSPGTMGVGANLDHDVACDIVSDCADLSMYKDGEVDAILARHILEHMIDPIKALREWRRVLKDDGKLVVMVPDYRFSEAISCDPSHTHAFTPDSLASLLDAVGGFSIEKVENVKPGYVTMMSINKVPSIVPRVLVGIR